MSFRIKNDLNSEIPIQNTITTDSSQIINLLNNVVISQGDTLITSEFNIKKRNKILIFGNVSLNNVDIKLEISPDNNNPINFYETFENINIISGTVYSFINLFTDFFRLKITNNESSSITLNLFTSSKN